MNRIEKEYRDMLSQIEPEENFEKDLLETLTNMQKQKEKPKTLVGRKIFLRQAYQAAVAGIACISIVLIGTMTPVSATIMNMYQRFYQSVTKTYSQNVQANEISIKKNVSIGNGSDIYIQDAVFTSNGMNIRYEVQEKGNYQEIYPGEISLEAEDGTKILLNQETYMPISQNEKSQKYIGAYQCSNSDKIKNLLNKKIVCKMEFLGEQDHQVKEEAVQIKFTPSSIYQLKILSKQGDWVYNSKRDLCYKINKVTMDAWYMKVDYQWQSEKYQDFFTFELSDENKKQYVSLGAVEKEQKEKTYSGTIFFERTKDDVKKLNFKPVWMKEYTDGQQKEEKVEGKVITVIKGE